MSLLLYLSLFLYLHTHICILLALLLWSTLSNTGREVLSLPGNQRCGLQGPKCSSVCLNPPALEAAGESFVVRVGHTVEASSPDLSMRTRMAPWEAGVPSESTGWPVNLAVFSPHLPHTPRCLPLTCQPGHLPMSLDLQPPHSYRRTHLTGGRVLEADGHGCGWLLR